MSAKRFINLTAAGTTNRPQAVRLDRVVVGTGEAAATVELRTAGANVETIGTIAVDNPDNGRVFDLELPPGGLTVIVVGAPDVTILYD